jgi:hypothetical protein
MQVCLLLLSRVSKEAVERTRTQKSLSQKKEFKFGDLVPLDGLQSKPHCNGKIVAADHADPQTAGQLIIQVPIVGEQEPEKISVKVSCLHPLRPADINYRL